MEDGSAREDLLHIPAPETVPWPRFIEQPVTASRSSSGESGASLEIVLGPTTRLPAKLGTVGAAKLKMSRNDIVSLANCSSSANCIRLSDYLRLSSLLPANGPQLSFGSALHVGDRRNAMCLVCSAVAASRL